MTGLLPSLYNSSNTILDWLNVFGNVKLSENITNQENRTYAYLYTDLKDYFLKWYLPVVLCLGFLGTAFCVYFLVRSNLFPKNLLVWLLSICIADLLVLLLEGLWMFMKVWFTIDIRDYNNPVCILHTTLSNYLFYWSAYVQSFLSLQRGYLVLRPFSVNSRLLTVKWILTFLAFTSIILVFPILPYPMYWRVVKGDCDPLHTNVFRLTTLLDLIFWGIIPTALMTTSTILIWCNLIQRHSFFGNLEAGELGSNPVTHLRSAVVSPHRAHFHLRRVVISTTTPSWHCQSQPGSKPSTSVFPTPARSSFPLTSGDRKSVARDSIFICGGQRQPGDSQRHVAPLLIGMNLVYLTSVYPLITYFICINFILTEVDRDIHRFVYYLFRSLCFLNTCSNWIFYCLAGRKFRHQTQRLLLQMCCGGRAGAI